MEYAFFYDLCKYTNEIWRGFFSDKELACNAYDYKIEYDLSIERGEPTNTMLSLCELISEDMGRETQDNLTIEAMQELFDCFSDNF